MLPVCRRSAKGVHAPGNHTGLQAGRAATTCRGGGGKKHSTVYTGSSSFCFYFHSPGKPHSHIDPEWAGQCQLTPLGGAGISQPCARCTRSSLPSGLLCFAFAMRTDEIWSLPSRCLPRTCFQIIPRGFRDISREHNLHSAGEPLLPMGGTHFDHVNAFTKGS